jgi:CRISPR-associated protein Cmr4
MYHIARPLFLHCETPLHAGSGSELGIIDLPIQRERHTDFPKIEGSSLKGALRERFEQVLIPGERKKEYNNPKINDTFGPEGIDGLYAGALGITDARLLLFPVKSMKGVFAWVTCPDAIKRFVADLKLCEIEFDFENIEKNTCTANSELLIGGTSIVLEEYTFAVSSNDNTSKLSNWLATVVFGEDFLWFEKLKTNLVVLDNDNFKDFVSLSTEVITRTKIDNITGTVQDGALFTEEYLPAESILYSMVLSAPIFTSGKKSESGLSDAKSVHDFFLNTLSSNECGNRVQVGANATLGKGHIFAKLI